MRARNSLFIIYWCAAIVMVTPHIPRTLPWVIGQVVAVGSVSAFAVYSFVADARGIAQRRKEELRVQHIRELEKELGYTPLELGDPTAPVTEPVTDDRPRKESQ